MLAEFSNTPPQVTPISVPCFRKLQSIRGNRETIFRHIDELKSNGSDIWLEIVYEGDEIAGNLREQLDEIIAGTGLDILRVKNNRIVERALKRMDNEETLDDLDVHDVFNRCLDAHDVPDEQRAELLTAYREVITSLHETDSMAE